jgi:dienelactone hydrolase
MACGGASPSTAPTAAPVSAPVSASACGAFTVQGDTSRGAAWTYVSRDGGVDYRLEGVLILPAGAARGGAVVVSHGKGGLPAAYSANVGRIMAGWGLAVIAPRYTHANDSDGRNGALQPAGPDGASEANVLRAHKARDLLACVAGVDLGRVAAHGHSMGAFVTAQLLGRFPGDFRAGTHTAGGAGPGVNATDPDVAARIASPYQMHHGDADMVVSIALDRSLDSILNGAGTRHELNVYRGYTHDQMAADATMLERVRAWYVVAGVL